MIIMINIILYFIFNFTLFIFSDTFAHYLLDPTLKLHNCRSQTSLFAQY